MSWGTGNGERGTGNGERGLGLGLGGGGRFADKLRLFFPSFPCRKEVKISDSTIFSTSEPCEIPLVVVLSEDGILSK